MAEENKTKKRVATGVVTRDKMNKTRRVEISRLVKHATYGKYVRRRTVCYVHDENNESHLGDTVEIIESRPLSKLKSWTLVRIVKKAPLTAMAAKPETTSAPEGETPASEGQG